MRNRLAFFSVLKLVAEQTRGDHSGLRLDYVGGSVGSVGLVGSQGAGRGYGNCLVGRGLPVVVEDLLLS